MLLSLMIAACGPEPVAPQPPADASSLGGAHLALECGACHESSEPFDLPPSDCAACHAPERPALHYPGSCGVCHEQGSWWLPEFSHASFPLEDGHALVCEACHDEPDLLRIGPICLSCHESDRPEGGHYDVSDCSVCHEPTSWPQSTIEHPGEISVIHPGVENCFACHVDAVDLAVFSCDHCHEHRPEVLDPQHEGVADYTTEPDPCLACHFDELL